MLQLIKTIDHQPLQSQGPGPCSNSSRGRLISNLGDSGPAREYVREVVYNLIPARSSNPVVRDILEELDTEFKTRLSFRYRPEQESLDVASRDSVLSQEKKAHIIDRLWQLTQVKINAIVEQRTCWAQD